MLGETFAGFSSNTRTSSQQMQLKQRSNRTFALSEVAASYRCGRPGLGPFWVGLVSLVFVCLRVSAIISLRQEVSVWCVEIRMQGNHTRWNGINRYIQQTQTKRSRDVVRQLLRYILLDMFWMNYPLHLPLTLPSHYSHKAWTSLRLLGWAEPGSHINHTVWSKRSRQWAFAEAFWLT